MHYGVCSNYLKNLQPGQTVECFVRRYGGHFFYHSHLPRRVESVRFNDTQRNGVTLCTNQRSPLFLSSTPLPPTPFYALRHSVIRLGHVALFDKRYLLPKMPLEDKGLIDLFILAAQSSTCQRMRPDRSFWWGLGRGLPPSEGSGTTDII